MFACCNGELSPDNESIIDERPLRRGSRNSLSSQSMIASECPERWLENNIKSSSVAGSADRVVKEEKREGRSAAEHLNRSRASFKDTTPELPVLEDEESSQHDKNSDDDDDDDTSDEEDRSTVSESFSCNASLTEGGRRKSLLSQ